MVVVNLDEMSNEMLIQYIRENKNEQAKDYFFERNIAYAHYVVGKFFKGKTVKRQQDYDELFSSAQIGLVKAFNKFNVESGFKFLTFADKVITNEILILLRKIRKDVKYGFISTSYALNDEENSYIEDVLVSEDLDIAKQVEVITVAKDNMKLLTDREKLIYDLYVNKGMTQCEIAEIVGIRQENISRNMSRIRKKLK